VVGMHNVLNLTSCIVYLLQEGFAVSEVQRACTELEMVKRRQEIRGTYREMVVIDDFAHHPRAITVTLDAIRARFKGRKVITVFEPISATARSSIFQNEFRDSLAASDKVIIAKPDLPTTALGGKDLDGELLASEISKQGKQAVCVHQLEDLRKVIDQYAEKDAALLILSNRTCLGLWESGFVQELSR
jgi:UDP-N-acetylmuramate: L-alanyl-gamma-D-glutamyl-meso-diaminopimelate ligase